MKLHASPEEMEQLSQRLLSFFGDFGILKRLDEQLQMERREGGKVIYFSELTGAPVLWRSRSRTTGTTTPTSAAPCRATPGSIERCAISGFPG